jgi:diadenosine tetraphosphate (Ap4A) HIT family hydrolase
MTAASDKSACGICTLINKICTGRFPDFVAELKYSYVILGREQFYRGYCVLLLKHHATALHDLPAAEARGWFDEILAVAAAIDRVTGPRRLNHECLGNQEPHLHWHIFPRAADDPMTSAPVWLRPEAERNVPLERSDAARLIEALRLEIARQRQDRCAP